ncbi:transposase [Paraburkholderia acidipaludis]|uniref:transposase n=1 Tax=Paraburkholderia acidipaludis TaxID=660537 RepID=UPI0006939DDF|nr:transposase [Paraburkholderia acidipaludis]
MNFEELSDDEWMMVSSFIADEPPIRLNRRGRPRAEPRVVANAVLWILTTGESWSRLPARYPSGPTCRRRFDEWHVSGTLGEIVQRLTQVGRQFVYVPEPAPPVSQAAALPAVEAEQTAEDDGLPAVYWKSPEAWQAPVAASAPAFADPIESMTRQLACTDPVERARSDRADRAPAVCVRADEVAAAPAVLPTTQALSAPHDESPAAARRVSGASSASAPQPVQVAEWRGYVMNLTVQPVRNRMYRAAVEILKDGRRVERSGLIGPPFQDRETAKHFAYDWARKWIERECCDASHTASAARRSTVVTRSAPPAGGNVRLAPLQRYTASGTLLPGAEVRDADTAACSNERRTAEPHFRPHARTHAG